jgi:hypothetical protein
MRAACQTARLTQCVESIRVLILPDSRMAEIGLQRLPPAAGFAGSFTAH